MTSVRLDVPQFNVVPWHDAEILRFGIELDGGGEASVTLRCLLHPDELRAALSVLHLTTPTVEIGFLNASDIRLNIHANTTNSEWIDTWQADPIEGSSGLECRITGSAGALCQLRAAEIWASEVFD